MKPFFTALLLFLSFSVFANTNIRKDELKPVDLQLTSIPAQNIKLKGYPGEKIDLCISRRIISQDIDHLIEPFHLKNETWAWQSEFWGKWMLSAVAAWKYYTGRRIDENNEIMQFQVCWKLNLKMVTSEIMVPRTN